MAGVSLLFSAADAQSWKDQRYEIIGGVGATQFFGDIGGFTPGDNIAGFRDFSFKHTRLNVNAGLRYRILKDLTARGELAAGFFHSTDERGSNINRNFESRSLFLEPSITAEYYILNRNNRGVYKNSGAGVPMSSLLNLYVFTGMGALWYDVSPNASLAPRATRMNGCTPTIPLGIGTNLNFTNSINFGAELGRRFLFSDNVDGYSSRFSRFNDAYYFLNFVVSYKP